MEVHEHTEMRLDAIQDLFGRVLLQVPQSSPRLATCAALGLQGMQWRLWEAKILLVLAIWRQEDGCLAREVLQEQVRMGWPGLGSEVQAICQAIGIQDATSLCTVTRFSEVNSSKLQHSQKLNSSPIHRSTVCVRTLT